MKIKNSPGYTVFSIFNYAFLILLAAACIVPFIHILAVSLSNQASSTANAVGLFPIGINLKSYEKALSAAAIWKALGVTISRMALGTLYGMFLTIVVAYPLSFSERYFRGRKYYVAFFFITMIFNGGIIPYYILIDNLGLMDSIWPLVLGSAPIGAIIILLNFYRQLNVSLFESARIDGASHYTVLWKIYFPLSMPSIATLSLMSLIAHWNEWFGGMIYMKSPAKYPLQTYLLTSMQNATQFTDLYTASSAVSHQSLTAAQTIFTILPVLLAFPVLQKYIKSGLVLGSVKE